jgi:hypothetical protein
MSTRTQRTVTTSLPPVELLALDRVCKRDNLTRHRRCAKRSAAMYRKIPTGRSQSKTHFPTE